MKIIKNKYQLLIIIIFIHHIFGLNNFNKQSDSTDKQHNLSQYEIIFFSGGESKNIINEWRKNDKGNIYGDERSIGPCPGSRVDAVRSPVHSGKYACRWYVTDPGKVPMTDYTGQVKGMYWDISTNAAYYSCWYYFPETYTMNEKNDNWNNIMQWKNQNGNNCYPIAAVFTKNYSWSGESKTYLTIGNLMGEKWGALIGELPKNKWFQLQVYYYVNKSDEGEVKIWLDGQKVVELLNIKTQKDEGTPFVMFGIGNYPSLHEKKDLFFYTDDFYVTKKYLPPAAFDFK